MWKCFYNEIKMGMKQSKRDIYLYVLNDPDSHITN